MGCRALQSLCTPRAGLSSAVPPGASGPGGESSEGEGWRVENGGWNVEGKRWKVEGEGWRVEDGKLRLEGVE